MSYKQPVFYVPENMSLYINDKDYKDLNLSDITEVDNGVIVMDHKGNKPGVYYPDGELCTSSVLTRFKDENNPKTYGKIKISKKVDYINEKVIYLGKTWAFIHFGHFLIEGVNRLWPLLYPKYKNYKVVISIRNKKNIPDFVRKMLNAMGIKDENIILIKKNTQFAKVIVPNQSSIIGVNILPITKKVFDKISDGIPDAHIKTYDKIYMSRRLMGDKRTFGEKQVENIFEKNGFKIIYPEKLPLEHQITLIRNCKELAGTSGSALHMAFFMKHKGRVIQIKRNTGTEDNINVQYMIDRLGKIETVLVYGSIEIYKTDHFTYAPQIIGITPQMLEFFDDNGFRYTKTDIVFDDVEFNRYLHYLRIYKIKRFYSKLMNPLIRTISFLGITKPGREVIRDILKRLFKVIKI